MAKKKKFTVSLKQKKRKFTKFTEDKITPKYNNFLHSAGKQ